VGLVHRFVSRRVQGSSKSSKTLQKKSDPTASA
jgi:hypothetical protein